LPQTIDVVRTRAQPLGLDVVVGPAAAAAEADWALPCCAHPGVNGTCATIAFQTRCTRTVRPSSSPPICC
jgi:hypothetical protein